MILIVSNERDLTADYIVLELVRRGISYIRLNSENLPKYLVSYVPTERGDKWNICLDGSAVEFENVRAAYYRRPGEPKISDHISAVGLRKYCQTEWTALLSSALNSLGRRWLNSPLAIYAAEDKPRQLAVAVRLGFSVPVTVVSNDIHQGQRLLRNGRMVAKPLREALIEDDESSEVIFTSEVKSLDDSFGENLSLAPVIFQRLFEKTSDIRVTVVGGKCFSAEILSQESSETKIDWRKGEFPNIEHRSHDLPIDIQCKCIAIVKEFDLKFGAIDLILDADGNYWFLEINPNGQWAWIENRTGLLISSAIVDELEEISRC
ncbi:MvdC/MvdD family ATP grasp protein [Thalassospira alkalitolerans]|uniref:MvdC/MvdD family ATP grasp protein n=1 Tax=Thalassospira alkalitolerans TaxID=1293890 RepID=UPI003AA998CB